MSIVDPVALRRKNRYERAGRRGFLVAAVGGAVVMAVAAFLLGLAVGWLAGDFRHMLINSVFDDRERMPTYWGPATLGLLWSVGIFGVMVSALVTLWLIDAYRGDERPLLLLPPLGLCGVAAGVVVDSQRWLAPLKVGMEVDPVLSHEDKPWDVFAWAAYYSQIWFPILAVVLAALVVLGSFRFNRRVGRQIAERTRLLRDGRRTKGRITDVALRTSTNDQGQRSVVGADVVVNYTDNQGIERWVTRRSRDHAIMSGSGSAQVLYDPLWVDDDNLVFVSFHPDPYPPEWIGATL